MVGGRCVVVFVNWTSREGRYSSPTATQGLRGSPSGPTMTQNQQNITTLLIPDPNGEWWLARVFMGEGEGAGLFAFYFPGRDGGAGDTLSSLPLPSNPGTVGLGQGRVMCPQGISEVEKIDFQKYIPI